VRAVGAHLLEPLARLLQFPDLIGAGLAALLLRREDRIDGAGMADERPATGAAQRRLRVFLHLPFRPLSAGGGQAQPVEDAAHLLGNLFDDLDNPFHPLAEGDAAPLGVVAGGFVIRRHVLGPVARQGVDEFVLPGEVVMTIVQVHTVAVP